MHTLDTISQIQAEGTSWIFSIRNQKKNTVKSPVFLGVKCQFY